ncbi:hypothetical protein BpJC7_28900 [Weizmannia acidilactici]|uniref:RNase H type-1 domain-containing protein n=1 Tax=Weizmannia acidilactici TaxID=2607726 RepID=A0A5J4JMI9_9BACI|nr:hypothetical protein [Weizmannia acidilactici]GER65721.1 hypothetical protein BpJC4_01920 [Weizmannia acidilactici]GER71587.1 hypothetical protein BpJC7_28900 [Weizmannia acidilactici]GER72077.1 hypothetical protein BpPP18_01440 [Weizmannia acidilactici]
MDGPQKLKKEIKMKTGNVTIYFDGRFDQTTNRAGIGVAVYDEKCTM